MKRGKTMSVLGHLEPKAVFGYFEDKKCRNTGSIRTVIKATLNFMSRR